MTGIEAEHYLAFKHVEAAVKVDYHNMACSNERFAVLQIALDILTSPRQKSLQPIC